MWRIEERGHVDGVVMDVVSEVKGSCDGFWMAAFGDAQTSTHAVARLRVQLQLARSEAISVRDGILNQWCQWMTLSDIKLGQLSDISLLLLVRKFTKVLPRAGSKGNPRGRKHTLLFRSGAVRR